MKVQYETCFSGNNKVQVRLTLPSGNRYVIDCPEETWCRSVAIRAKDLVSAETGELRHKIRFI